MSKIYVITRGEYSEYTILGATLDEKLAHKLAKMHSNEFRKANVEEFEDGQMTDWYTPKPFKRVMITENLDEFTVEEHWEDGEDAYPVAKIHHGEDDGKWRYEVDMIEAPDNNHAIKIAFDTLAKYAAMENMR